ncbi:succinate dehydrogenase assembly factor 2, partial [Neisseria dentiae]
MPVFDEAAKRRIRYQTRRGLLELDIVLGRF